MSGGTARAGGRRHEISRPDKVLFPREGLTKADLADYYEAVADAMLPHLRDRPLHLHRYPDGIEGQSFHQKRVPEGAPDWVDRVTVEMEEGGSLTQLLAQRRTTLRYLVDQAALTPHAWLARKDRPHHPDQLAFDLDPPTQEIQLLRDAARALCEQMAELGLPSYVKTSGSRGFHVVTPLDRSASFDESRELARLVADRVAGADAERLTTAQRKERRGDRLFIDTTRNAYAQTLVAPYAVRARPGAPVSTPIEWEELDGAEPGGWTVSELPDRLARHGDPWVNIRRRGHSLRGPLQRLRRG